MLVFLFWGERERERGVSVIADGVVGSGFILRVVETLGGFGMRAGRVGVEGVDEVGILARWPRLFS